MEVKDYLGREYHGEELSAQASERAYAVGLEIKERWRNMMNG